ncbi:hypothetical protein [uncultured Brachyspira sp.]|uniref:hypothetical protein n=1 Tax=uncultured Brachyspira sp. TaxID=221953 RepID=UPI00262C9ED1|nr:hypothetical protein [uncultured Brachyspira sp.]
MCKFKPDYYIESYHFNGFGRKGIKIKVKMCIINYNLKINLNYIHLNLYSLYYNSRNIKNNVGEFKPLYNLCLNKKTKIRTDLIMTIYWKHIILFLPVLLNKYVTLLIKGKISYDSILKSGVDNIEEIKTVSLNSFK